jgi:hypothetical protein
MPNNTPEQRKMDFHNNEVGRNLSSELLNVNDIRKYVLNSKKVIRFPEEVQ